MFRDSLSCFFPTWSSGLLFDIVAARAIALLVRGALREGKLVHLGRLLFHAEERLCVRGQKQRSRELAVLLLLLLQDITSRAAIFTKHFHAKPTCISANTACAEDLSLIRLGRQNCFSKLYERSTLHGPIPSLLELTLSIPGSSAESIFTTSLTFFVRKVIFGWWRTQTAVGYSCIQADTAVA